MHFSTDRREFLRSALLAGAGLPVLLKGGSSVLLADTGNFQIENGFLGIRFEEGTGRLGAWRKDGTPFLADAVSLVHTAEGVRRTTDPDYQRHVRIEKYTDALGDGQRLVAVCKDGRKALDLEVRVTLYEARDMMTVETVCRNVSEADSQVVRRIEPVHTESEADSGLYWPGVTKILTNGKMYYDPGKVLDFAGGDSAESWWNVGLYSGERQPGLVIGYLENKSGLGQLTMKHRKGNSLEVTASSDYEQEFTLKPGAHVSSDRLAFSAAANPFSALESYARMIGDLNQVKLNPIINGWCSWFYTFPWISEEEVLLQAEFAAKHLKPYGFEYMQIDDGFYRAFGDWRGNDRFPHGMKWIAQEIRKMGLKPGIWLAPYAIGAGSDVYKNHPEWLIRNTDGSLKSCGPFIKEGSEEERQPNPPVCGLDITRPEAAQWLEKLFNTAANEWDYDFIKIDFVDWTLLSAQRYWDRGVTRAQAYRKGAEIMRRAMGPKKHLLDCGPGQLSVGYIDSMRTELDQPPVTWNQYFLQSASSGPAMAKRYYFHKRTWINDVDHIVLSTASEPQAQAIATLIALSGGNTISGDRMSELDVHRVDILRRILPAYGEAAKPVDLFESDRPQTFVLPIKKKFGQWTVLGMFNADENASVKRTLAVERFGLDPARTYIAYDFWRQRFFGEIKGELSANLDPASVTLLAIHEKRGVPQVISTDRHVVQGGLELENVAWDEKTKTLKGESLGPAGTDHRVSVYLPESHPLDPLSPWFYYRDFPGYSVKLTEPHILRLHLRFDKRERVAWQINTETLFK